MPQIFRVRGTALIIQKNAVLLIEYDDENGLHYNLPGGGVEPGETVRDAVRREAHEEANVVVEVGPLAFVYEYAPHLDDWIFGAKHEIVCIFACKLAENSVPAMPKTPDPNQTGVKWVPLATMDQIVLYPDLRQQIRAYAQQRPFTHTLYLEEWEL